MAGGGPWNAAAGGSASEDRTSERGDDGESLKFRDSKPPAARTHKHHTGGALAVAANEDETCHGRRRDQSRADTTTHA